MRGAMRNRLEGYGTGPVAGIRSNAAASVGWFVWWLRQKVILSRSLGRGYIRTSGCQVFPIIPIPNRPDGLMVRRPALLTACSAAGLS